MRQHTRYDPTVAPHRDLLTHDVAPLTGRLNLCRAHFQKLSLLPLVAAATASHMAKA